MPTDLPVEAFVPPPSDKNEDWHTTSQDLIDALGPVGLEYAKPKVYENKIDLSYTNAYTAVHDPKKALEESTLYSGRAPIANIPRLELKGIFVRYLRNVDSLLAYQECANAIPPTTSRLDEVLRDYSRGADLPWLRRYGWDITDLMNWSWILKAPRPDLATNRLTLITESFSKGMDVGQAVPFTIFLFLLRRQNHTALGLRHLLHHAWKFMSKASRALPLTSATTEEAVALALAKDSIEKVVPNPKENSAGIAEDVFMIMVIRLLRHARRVWPAACESITSMFCQYLNGSNFHRSISQSQAQLTFMYNTVLRLLCIPASLQPFISATPQQRAQFAVLRRMNQFEPPLAVDRRGYRAVTAMQLMHKKTAREREWALLKSRSWPPWKQDRLGTDAVIGPEYGITRAKEVMERAEEAGYAMNGWEDAASLLTGWDTDGSPTIQSRRAFRSDEMRDRQVNIDAKIWANRVRATRTLNEAWALFQGYKDGRESLKEQVYLAMFEKIVFNTRRRAIHERKFSSQSQPPDALPGDKLEVWPEPTSPLENIYVRTKAPTIDEFIRLVDDDGVMVKGRLLALFLEHATSLAAGIRIVLTSSLPLEYKSILLGDSSDNPVYKESKTLREIPPYIFASFLGFLSRAPRTLLKEGGDGGSFDLPVDIVLSPTLISAPLVHAFRLMRLRKPVDRRPWTHLLGALSRKHVVVDHKSPKGNHNAQHVLSWTAVTRLLQWMDDLNVEHDLEVFMKVCRALENATISSLRLLHEESSSRAPSEIVFMARDILSKGLAVVKAMFKNVVRADSMQGEIPAKLLEEKTEIDHEVEQRVAQMSQATESAKDNGTDVSIDSDDPNGNKTFLPPSCLLPRLLGAPRPACIHQFVRVLGLSCDYDGLLDLIEWMALYSDELKAQADEQRSGTRMFRRCLIATRVFLERSWTYYDMPERDKHVLIERQVEPAPAEVWEATKKVIEENGSWGGWPSDEEVEEYIQIGRFL